MRRMHCISKHHRFIGRQLVQQVNRQLFLMKAACFAGSSLREIAVGLRCSIPRRCRQGDQPEPPLVLDAAFPRDPAPISRLVRGSASVIHAVSLASCSAVSRQTLPS